MKTIFSLATIVLFSVPSQAEDLVQSIAVPAQAPAQSVTAEAPSVDASLDVSPMSDRLLFKVGSSWSSISDARPLGQNGELRKRPSIALGMDYEHPLALDFSVVTGVSIAQKGFDSVGSDIATSLRINYFTIPFQAKFNHYFNDRHRASLSVGPYVALAIGKAAYEQDSGALFDRSTQGVSSFDYGAKFGLDYEMTVRDNWSFLLGAAYELGVANISDSLFAQSTRALSASVGMGLKL